MKDSSHPILQILFSMFSPCTPLAGLLFPLQSGNASSFTIYSFLKCLRKYVHLPALLRDNGLRILRLSPNMTTTQQSPKIGWTLRRSLQQKNKILSHYLSEVLCLLYCRSLSPSILFSGHCAKAKAGYVLTAPMVPIQSDLPIILYLNPLLPMLMSVLPRCTMANP